jgi:tetratricopeptide (TPR) repeat protein
VKENAKVDAYRRSWATILSNYGLILQMSGRSKEAEKYDRKALALRKELWTKFSGMPADPLVVVDEHFPAPTGIGIIRTDARPNYAAELAVSYQNLSHCLENTGQLVEAEKLLREGLESFPDHAALNNGLAWLLATSGDFKSPDPAEAVRYAEKAVAAAPGNGEFFNTLGVVHYRAGNWKGAITALEKSMQLRKGGDANDWFFLAMGHRQLKEKKQARQWYDRAVQWMEKNQPGNTELRRFRREAEELLGVKKKM